MPPKKNKESKKTELKKKDKVVQVKLFFSNISTL